MRCNPRICPSMRRNRFRFEALISGSMATAFRAPFTCAPHPQAIGSGLGMIKSSAQPYTPTPYIVNSAERWNDCPALYWYADSFARRPMTTVDVVFKYGLPPGENEFRALSDA